MPNADHRTVIDLPLPEFRHRESRTRIVDVHTRINEPHLSRCCVDERVTARLEVIDHVLVVVGDLPRRRREGRAGIVALGCIEIIRTLSVPRLVVNLEMPIRLVQRLNYLPLARRDDVPFRIEAVRESDRTDHTRCCPIRRYHEGCMRPSGKDSCDRRALPAQT